MRDLRKLPDGWRVVRLGDIATVLTGTTPPREKLDFYGGGIPWLKPSDLARSQFVSTSAEYLTNDGASLARLVPKDTVLVSCIGTIGEVSISRVAMCFNQQINALIPGSLITSSFLYWSCASRADYMERIAAKTAVPILNKSEFSKIPIMLPPLNEQRAIAAVLDAIDEAIERTEAVISATERLRDALLHELLTRGVPGWHTEWRNVPGLGTIPADWQVVRLGAVATHITSGSRAWSRHFCNDGALFIRSQNISKGAIDKSDSVFVRPPADAEAVRTRIRKGDLLVSITGEPGKVTVADEAIGRAFVSQHVALARLSDHELSKFAGEFLQSRNGKDQFRRMAYGQTRPGLSLDNVNNVRVPVPSPSERDSIVLAGKSHRRAIEANKLERDRLKSLQESLTDALLTGRVRALIPMETILG